MTVQDRDRIYFDVVAERLVTLAPIVPDPLPRRMRLRLEPWSTANYYGWEAVWRLKDGKLWLLHLRAYGFLYRRRLFSRREDEVVMGRAGWFERVRARLLCRDAASAKTRESSERREGYPAVIHLRDIFGREGPIFASWVTGDVLCTTGDNDEGFSEWAPMSSHIRTLTIAAGRVTGDIVTENPEWRPEYGSKMRSRELEERYAAAMEANAKKRERQKADRDGVAGSTVPRTVMDPEREALFDAFIKKAQQMREQGRKSGA